MMGEAEIGFGVVVADVSNHVAEKLLVIREFPVLDVLANDVAEEAAEILVTREGEEGTRIGKHPYEMSEESNG